MWRGPSTRLIRALKDRIAAGGDGYMAAGRDIGVGGKDLRRLSAVLLAGRAVRSTKRQPDPSLPLTLVRELHRPTDFRQRLLRPRLRLGGGRFTGHDHPGV